MYHHYNMNSCYNYAAFVFAAIAPGGRIKTGAMGDLSMEPFYVLSPQ